MTVDTFCVIPLSVCNATQCIILYKVIICATCVTIHTFCYTNVCGLYNVYIICTHPTLRSIYTQCVISHTLCNLCVLFYFYTNQVCFYTQCVVLQTFLLLGPINLDLRYFVAKSVFVIYAFFGVNFILRKFCLCKRNDKYEVWITNPNPFIHLELRSISVPMGSHQKKILFFFTFGQILRFF